MDWMIWLILAGLILVFIFSKFNKAEQKTGKAPKKSSAEQRAQRQMEEMAYRQYLEKFTAHNNKETMPPIQSYVAGVRYANDDTNIDRQILAKKCKPGDRLLLIPEKHNPFDKAAVKIMRLSGEQIGFLDADLAIEIHPRLQEKLRVDATVIEIRTAKGYTEVLIELLRYSRKKNTDKK